MFFTLEVFPFLLVEIIGQKLCNYVCFQLSARDTPVGPLIWLARLALVGNGNPFAVPAVSSTHSFKSVFVLLPISILSQRLLLQLYENIRDGKQRQCGFVSWTLITAVSR